MGSALARRRTPTAEPSHPAWRLTAIAALLVVLLLPGVTASTNAPGAPYGHALTELRGFPALTAAAAALAAGQGPARGVAGSSCSFALGGGAQCALQPAGVPTPGNGTYWTNLSAFEKNSPPPRLLANMVWDDADGEVLLFGGCTDTVCNAAPYGDTWIFRGGQWSSPSLSNSPPSRSIAQMAYDPIDKEVVLFGGLAGSTPSYVRSDTWTFSAGLWHNISKNLTTPPSARYRGSMAYDAYDHYVVMFGGTSSTVAAPYAQTWAFVNQNWSDITNNVSGNPAPRYRGEMAYDPYDSELVLFGGCTSATRCPTKDTWTYQNLTWTNRTSTVTSSPSVRVYPAISTDYRDNATVLFGGVHDTATTGTGVPTFKDTWLFRGNDWHNVSANLTKHPPLRGEAMMAPDRTDNLTVLYGGFDQINLLDETWSFGPSIFAIATASPSTVDVGQTVNLQVTAASNALPLSYYYTQLPPGCATQNAASLACHPNATGSFNVSIQVNDTTSSSANTTANFSVVSDPEITNFQVTPTVVTQGSWINLSVAADLGQAPYHYAYRNLPSGCASTNAPTLSCRPASAALFTVESVVTDSVGFARYANVSLTVNPLPSVAAFTSSPHVIDLGQSSTFQVTVSGGTGPFHYNYTGLPTGCVAVDGPSWSCQPNHVGSYSMLVNVTDSFGWSANGSGSVRVNPALAIYESNISASQVDIGGTATLWVNTTGGTGPYTYNFTLPDGCLSSNASSIDCRPSTIGTYTIVATVTDTALASRAVRLNLSVVPLPRVTGFTADPTVIDLGLSMNLTVSAENGTLPYRYSYSGLPIGCQSQDRARLACIPSNTGLATVTVDVIDAWGAKSSQTVSFTVNRDPSITSFGASLDSFPLGGSTYLNVSASGGTGALAYIFGGLPAGCTSQDLPSLLCTPTASGSYTVNVTVRDGLGPSAQALVTINVLPAPPAPQTSSPLGSGSGWTLPILGLVLAVIALVAIALVLRRRRSPPTAPAETAPVPVSEPWEEGPPASP